MSDGSLPARRIGTRAAVRQEASNMVESEASAAPPAVHNAEPMELKQEPMDASPPAEPPGGATHAAVTSLLLAPLGPMTFATRKRKANFSNEETETLVRDVVQHFSALYGSEALRTESTRRNQRRSQLWTQIQKNVNDLGYTPRSIDDLKHKWRDLRLEVKRKITQRRSATKGPPTPSMGPVIDTKLSQLEDLVASTIGHHCTLDGEQEGMYMEPGVPRQSIFFTCRGEIGGDRTGPSASPRPTPEISLAPPLVGASPAQLSFVHVTEDTENGDHDMDVTSNVQIKTFPEAWPAMKEVCTLVTTQNLLPAQQTVVTAPTEVLTVKQEVVTAQPDVAPSRCESQNSIVSSPEGSLGNPAGQTECGNGSPAAAKADGETVQLKVESNEDDAQDAANASPDEDGANWQENPDDWERQSRSPPASETAPDDSMPSTSSQDGDPSSGGELPTNGDCAFPDPDDPKYRNMNRLLELEEQWDRLYHRELGIWEEERIQQQQQRNQDRELQQQLLTVLTDIRDELRQLRQERAADRQERAAERQSRAASNGALLVNNTSSPAVAITLKSGSDNPADTPAPAPRRRGRPRLIRPAPEPVRPIRPAPEPSPKS